MNQNIKFANQKIIDINKINGARFTLEDNSWGLVRASSNQPTLVLVAESFSSKRRLYDIIESIQEILKEYGITRDNYDQFLPLIDG